MHYYLDLKMKNQSVDIMTLKFDLYISLLYTLHDLFSLIQIRNFYLNLEQVKIILLINKARKSKSKRQNFTEK